MPSWVRGCQARHPFHYPRARCIIRLINRTLLFQSTVALVRGRGAGQGRALKCQPLSRTNRVDASSLRDERVTLARRVFVIPPVSPIRDIHASSPASQSRRLGTPSAALFGQRTMPDSPHETAPRPATQTFHFVPQLHGARQAESSCASRPNCRETNPFPEPTSLRYNVRSEDYTGQRDYAARLRCVTSFRETGWTHSADHLCLTPRRQAAHRAALHPPTP